MTATEMDPGHNEAKPCPQCGSALPQAGPFVPWCSACDWNVLPGRQPASSKLDRAYLHVSTRLGSSLLTEVVRNGSGGSDLTVSIVLAHCLGLAVLAAFPVLIALSAVLLYSLWPNVVGVVVGLLPLGLAAILVPWPLKHDGEGFVDPPGTEALRRLIERCASQLGAAGPEVLILDHRWNASWSRRGLRRRRTLVLGVPLFGSLSAQQRVALLSHELAHEVNGDPARRLVPALALRTLWRWAFYLTPTRIIRSGDGIAGLAVAVCSVFVQGLTLLAEWTFLAMIQLLGRESQRAEFRADSLAAAVAGSDASIALLETSALQHVFEFTVQRHTVRETDQCDFIDDLRRSVADVPSTEHARLRRASALAHLRLSETHPPTAQRITALAAHPAAPAIELTEYEQRQIDAEIARYSAPIRKRLVDEKRERLAHGVW